jgi:hypothetical protein
MSDTVSIVAIGIAGMALVVGVLALPGVVIGIMIRLRRLKKKHTMYDRYGGRVIGNFGGINGQVMIHGIIEQLILVNLPFISNGEWKHHYNQRERPCWVTASLACEAT